MSKKKCAICNGYAKVSWFVKMDPAQAECFKLNICKKHLQEITDKISKRGLNARDRT